ncbi:MAG: hypothetical protein ACJ74J_14905 [Blastocatellia bacterium]
MNCPNCGAESITTANFCRMCGVKLREMPAAFPSNSSPDLGRAIRRLIVGIGLLIVAFIPLLEGEPMIWWLLFPGVPIVSKGLRLLVQANVSNCVQNHPATQISSPTTPLQARISSNVRVRPTGELMPPSVTENTTRLLE